MKRLFLFFGLAGAVSSLSCPACNIHNYLAHSIYMASDIVLVKVLHHSAARDSSEVEVLQSYKGNLEVGSIHKFMIWAMDDTLIWLKGVPSDPMSFEELPVDFADEIKYLVSDDTFPPNPGVAKTCLLGVCSGSVQQGMDYFRQHHSENFGILAHVADSLATIAFERKFVKFAEWRLTNSIAAVFLHEHDSIPALLNHIFELYNRSDSTLDIDEAGMYPGPSPLTLWALVRFSKDTRYATLVTGRLTEMLRTAKGRHLSEILFALVYSAALDANKAIDFADPTQKDAIATGLMLCCNQENRWWQWDEAKVFATEAGKFAETRQLKKIIEEEFD